MGLQKKLENIFSAAAFAENGEFETASKIASRSVLLVLRGTESDRASIKYALNVSRRMRARLEVIYVAPDVLVGDSMNFIKSEAGREGIELKEIKGEGCIKKGVIEHTKKSSDIEVVVVESGWDREEECTEKDLLKSWKAIGCPLVIVSEALRA